jgi:glyoxylate reductase
LGLTFVSGRLWATFAGKFKQGLAPALDPEGKTLGIVGMGGIGSVVAHRMAAGWGMKVLYHNRNPIKAGEKGAEFEYVSSLEEMLGRSDVVSLNLPVRPFLSSNLPLHFD